MGFDNNKKITLEKLANGRDKSLIGHIDKGIIKLVSLINSMQNFYTTSSCAGRILVQAFKANSKKHETKRLLVSHSPLTYSKLSSILNRLPANMEVWFYMEAFILHVAARTIDDAIWFVNKAYECGLKRSGLMSARKNKYIIEVIGNEHMELPIAINKELIVSEDYLRTILNIANKKLEKNKNLRHKFLLSLAQP